MSIFLHTLNSIVQVDVIIKIENKLVKYLSILRYKGKAKLIPGKIIKGANTYICIIGDWSPLY